MATDRKYEWRLIRQSSIEPRLNSKRTEDQRQETEVAAHSKEAGQDQKRSKNVLQQARLL